MNKRRCGSHGAYHPNIEYGGEGGVECGPSTVGQRHVPYRKSGACLLRKICGRASTPAVCAAPLPLFQGQSFTDKKRGRWRKFRATSRRVPFRKSNVCLLRKICGRASTPAVCVAPLPLCQGQSFTDKKCETRSEYAKRLKKAAATLLKAFVDKAIGDMEERCRRLCKARSGHFEAGGMARVLPDRACKCF